MIRFASTLFVSLLFTLNALPSLRYFFKWGEPVTSPTYSALPSQYFLAWNAILVSLLLVTILQVRKISLVPISLYLLLALSSFTCLLLADSFFVRGLAKSVLFYGLIFVFLVANTAWLDFEKLANSMSWLASIGIVFLGYQIWRYYVFGVLPSHSHEGHSIRFGSFYDDSIIFGILLPMFAGLFWGRNSAAAVSITMIFALGAISILTGSLTSMAVVLIYIIWKVRTDIALLPIVALVTLLALLLGFKGFVALFAFKADSIAGHLEGWHQVTNIDPIALTGFYPMDAFAESGYLLLLYNMGLPGVLVILALHVATFRAAQKLIRFSSYAPIVRLAGATEGLTLSVVLTNLNLPAVISAPVYLWVVLLSAITIREAKKLEATTRVSRPSTPHDVVPSTQ